MTQLFQEQNPAKNINELLDFLNADRPEQFLFRGQIRHYGYLIPSVFRSASDVEKRKKSLIPIDYRLFWETISNRQRARFHIMDGLIQQLGRVIGNIISQQYGLSSECLDFTGTPKIAAFFATRKYPVYDHFDDISSNILGVIYRIKRHAQNILHVNSISSFDSIERRLNRIGGYYHEMPVWFESYLKLWELDPYNPQPDPYEQFAPLGGCVPAQLNTRPVILHYKDLKHVLEKIYGGEDQVKDSRLLRQDGGLLRPTIVFDGFIPNQGEIYDDPETGDLLISPSVAIADKVIGVIDALSYKDCEAFFFKHSKEKVDGITREYLWPDTNIDTVYRVTDLFAALNSKRYYLENELAKIDPEQDLIDWGYHD